MIRKLDKENMTTFIEINGDLFNVDKIQALSCTNMGIEPWKDSGTYVLKIDMENGVGSSHKVYRSEKERDEDFALAKKQLIELRKNYKRIQL